MYPITTNQVLNYATTNREGYKEHKSIGYIGRDCSELEKCTQTRLYTKPVPRHIWQEYLERAEDIRHSPVGKATYALRSQTIERIFADAKEKHAMRYTPYRGLAAVTAWVKLKFAAMNLKKLALHKWRPLLHFYLLLLQEATLRRCKVASLTAWNLFIDDLALGDHRMFPGTVLRILQIDVDEVLEVHIQVGLLHLEEAPNPLLG